MAKQYWGKWYVQYFCTSCDKRLTTSEVYYQQTCPHCGHLANGTILHHYRHSVRHLYESRRSYLFGFIPLPDGTGKPVIRDTEFKT